MEPIDYIEVALTTPRDRFIANHRFPFLVGADVLAKPRGPQQTVHGKEYPEIQRFLAGGPPPAMRPLARPIVLAVRKVHAAFPSMITVGRTSNNDVVVSDVQVSKFHCFFREQGGRFELVDADSTNGTFVGEDQLQPRGEAHEVRVGDQVRFGQVRFYFTDAASCWDLLRRQLSAP
jgi:hypothetical protein